MHTQKNRLPQRNQSGYISAAPHKTGAGILNLLTTKAHNRASGFFVRTVLPRLFRIRIMVGRTGPTSVGPVSLVAGVENPVRLATPRFSTLDGEFSKLTTKEATSWQTANNSANTLRVVTSRLKSIADSPALHTSPLSCNPTHCTDSTALFQPTTAPLYSAIWRKTSCLFRISSSSKTNSINSCSGPFLHLAAGGLRTSVTRGLPQ
ncbi:ash family protein [Escherichia coli]|nr:ash family protein [Escherichia coli]EHC1916008.1 ash family protein [Escherichia coli]